MAGRHRLFHVCVKKIKKKWQATVGKSSAGGAGRGRERAAREGKSSAGKKRWERREKLGERNLK
jgi:hypothetical protein